MNAKQRREGVYTSLMAGALREGEQAYHDCVPTPVRFYQAGTDPDVTGETVADGLCGFAWVRLKPANSPFANWLRKQENKRFRTHRGYPTGLEIWPAGVSQSWERKKAWANAVAKVLSDAGLKAYAGDRLD